MVEIRLYDKSDKNQWNDFVDGAKNSTFMHKRDYMDYHSDRFTDHSLMAYNKGKLIGILPCNVANGVAYSHQGLTFGGWLVKSAHFSSINMLEIFEAMKSHFQSIGVSKLIYKPTPHIYHSYPCEEDLYAIFRNSGGLVASSLSSTISLDDKLRFNENSRRGIKVAQSNNVTIEKSEDFENYWTILEDTLVSCHNQKPVHNIDEIRLLHQRFPQNIQLFVAKENGRIEGGVVMYISGEVAHAQYIVASERGKEIKVLPLLFSNLINDIFADKRYFDFGISTEDMGNYLNEGLISQKEGFGGRGIVYNVYEIEF